MRRLILALLGTTLVVVLVSGVALALSRTADTQPRAPEAPSTANAAPPSTQAGSTKAAQKSSAIPKRSGNAMRALRTATKKVPKGRAYDLEGERHHGKAVWEIKVASGKSRPYKLYISLDGRRVVRKVRHKTSGDAARVLKAKVTLRQAIRTAAKRVPWRLHEAEIDRHRGKLVWEVEFTKGGREREVLINAKTGKIIRVKTDDHDH